VFKQSLCAALALSCLVTSSLMAQDWAQFRGPNAAGVAHEKDLPVEFGPDKNVLWKTALPAGHSSPVLTKDRLFVTAYQPGKLFVICLKRADGSILWQREVPKPRQQDLHKSNSPASPSIVTDGQRVYAFFTDFGLLAYTLAGKELWRLPLGPFNNPFGMGASPILAGDKLLLNCDGESGSFFVAVDKLTGQVKWRVERPEFTRGFSTPVLFKPANAPLQVLVAGSLRLSAYDVATGREIWWMRGLTWQIKPTPVLGPDRLYVLGWAGGADPGQQEEIPAFAEALKKFDANQDGQIARAEMTDTRIAKAWMDFDLDRDGALGERDWRAYQDRKTVVNGILSFKLDPKQELRGDQSGNLLWRYEKALPNTPSPLLYQDVLYLLKEGGILTALNPQTGALLKQGRLRGALGDYYASPVAADGKLFALSEEGKLTVLQAGGEWEILAVNDLGEPAHATPAIADGKLYVRTHQTLFCFAKSEPAAGGKAARTNP
jgi:outer membrane protein assembly factor BamB